MVDYTDQNSFEQRVLELAADILALPEIERDAAIDQLQVDRRLADRVRVIVATAAGIGGFLDDPPAHIAAGIPLMNHEPRAGLPPGTSIADYSVIRLLGAGSMGDVYEAEQVSTGARVALKLIRPGVITRELRRRFDFEISTLAKLRHPHIAQLIEHGRYTSLEGERPFLVMELVDGPTITEHAEHAGMSREQRLTLMIAACEAVDHAHRSGVIHRDLKPRNILVTSATNEPKVLDFGVARAAGPEAATLASTPGERLIGSLPYMSPEQASGGDVDTRTDVYALGVVLYELLTGHPPMETTDRSIAEMLRAAQEGHQTRVHRRGDLPEGDLGVIVRAALMTDPKWRYQSAGALAEDLRRCLRGDPLSIRSPGTLYLLRTLARRHRVAVAASAAGLMMIAGGVTFGGVQFVRATRAEERLDTSLNQVAAAAQSLVVSVNRKLRDENQPLAARLIVIAESLTYLENARANVGDEPRILEAIVRAYVELGLVVGSSTNNSLGDATTAADLFARAIELGEQVLLTHDTDELRQHLASAYEQGAVLMRSKQPDDAVEHMRLAASHLTVIHERRTTPDHRSAAARRIAHVLLGAALFKGDIPATASIVDLRRQFAATYPDDHEVWGELGIAEEYLANHLVGVDPERGLTISAAAVESFRHAVALSPGNFSHERHLASTELLLVHFRTGRDSSEDLLALAENAIARSAIASANAVERNFARISHLQNVYSFVERGRELAKAQVHPDSSLDSREIAERVAGVARREVEAFRTKPGDTAAHPSEPKVLAAIEKSLTELAAGQ